MSPINFNIKFNLKSFLKDQEVKFKYQNKTVILKNKSSETISLDFKINKDTDRLEIGNFIGFEADPLPYIEIKNFTINDFPVEDFFNLISFDMKNNLYVENKTINQPQQVSFNGGLFLEVGQNKDRFNWFGVTFSKDKKEFVFRNETLNCNSDIGCFKGLGCLHDPPWKIFNLDHYEKHKNFQFVALGCSITAGTGIKKKEAWPYLLVSADGRVLNLGVPGGGIDQIFLNVIHLIRKKIKFKKLILLLPNFERMITRIKKHELFFDFLTHHHDLDAQFLGEDDHWQIYFDKDEYSSIIKRCHRKLVLGNNVKRNQKIINKLLSFLDNNSVSFYISSWDDDTYNFLKTCVPEKNLLPKFNEEKDKSKGFDNRHPSEEIHKKWVEKIKNQISH